MITRYYAFHELTNDCDLYRLFPRGLLQQKNAICDKGTTKRYYESHKWHICYHKSRSGELMEHHGERRNTAENDCTHIFRREVSEIAVNPSSEISTHEKIRRDKREKHHRNYAIHREERRV